MKLNCLIVDDEPIARKGMAEYVREVDFLNLVAECGSATQASSAMAKTSVELLLLDVQMPRLTGIDFLKTLSHPPMVIITTAYPEYALEGYALDVIDYLVKPIPFDRFLKAVTKAFDFHQIKTKASQQGGEKRAFFFVKSNGKYERVVFDEVLYVESMQNYIIIHLPGQKLIVYMTLTGIEEQLPAGKFMKVHKSYLIGLAHVNAVENNEVIIHQDRIPISRNLRDEVMKKIIGDNLLKR